MPGRILLLTNRVPYPLRDGGALAMDAMIRGYHDAGWQVHLLAMNTTRHHVPQEKLDKLYPQLAGFDTVEVDNRVRAISLIKNLLFSREPEHAVRFRSEAFAQKLRALLKTFQPDSVQLESPFLATYIPLIRAHGRAKVVYRAHNIEAQIWKRLAAESRGLKRAYLQNLARRMERFEQQLWQAADLIVPITEADAHFIRAQGVKTPIVMAPFGIAASGATPAFPPLPLQAYHIGAMDWLPNREAVRWFLDEAWPLVLERMPQLSFYFAGRAMPASFHEALPPQAFCAGEVSDAAAFIADKHLLVVPLRSGSGIRVKTLEGMAAGKLVISTDVGMQGIEAEAGVHFLRANTAEEFAAQIAWAAARPEEAKRIAAKGHALAAGQYDAVAIMRRLTEALLP
jgi:glycosyltransferase involved in cell wall biosynthesis